MKCPYFIFWFVALILTSVRCKKQESFPQVSVIGHAIFGLDVERNPFPGNTRNSLNHAQKFGLKNIEIDLQLTADNHWVLFHDDFLQRKTNFSGCIRNFELEDLNQVRYQGYKNIGIPALLELDFENFESVFLDIRHYDPCDNFSSLQLNSMQEDILALRLSFPQVKFLIVSRNNSVLIHFQNLDFLVCKEVSSYAEILQNFSNTGNRFYTIKNEQISQQEVQLARDFGLQILISGIKSFSGNRNAMRKNPNFVLTDDVLNALQLTK